MYHNPEIINKLKQGNKIFLTATFNPGDVSTSVRKNTLLYGQHPYATIICCSDSRVVPEDIFSAGIGELFVIRVAGNVITDSQLGSIQYAAGHLHTKVIIVLGHTHCGAVHAAIHNEGHGYVKCLTDEISRVIGNEKDEYKASCLNAVKGVQKIKTALADDHESITEDTDVIAAVYHISDGHIVML